ncbi:MAG TPA: hypothetical protein DEF42_18815 [Desulfosporosinus sp.]|nr:hypothetical protein [Desulfosporosinus sp.]
MHGEAVRLTSLSWEAEPRVHVRYYPEVWRSSQVSAWASLGMLSTKTLSSHELADLARMWTKPPDPNDSIFILRWRLIAA